MNKKNLTILLSAAALLMFTGCRKEIDLNDYLEINTTGYDTAGTVQYELNIDDILKDNPEAFDLESVDSFQAIDVAVKLDDTFSGKLDKQKDLKNGDKVSFTWDKNIDTKKLEKKYPVKFKYKNKTIKVDGLKETQKADPFEYVDVTFEGISPNGKMNVNSRLSQLGVSLSPSADKTTGLKNGDTVKLSFGSDQLETKEAFLKNGIIPDAVEKEYTVSGLASYAEKLDDIPKETMDKMDKQAMDILESKTSSWSAKKLGTKLLGNYMLTPKFNDDFNDKNNYVYFIYSIEAQKDDSTPAFTYYYYTYYTNVMNLEDGTCSVDLSDAHIPEASFFWGVSGEGFKKDDLCYEGFENLDSLFSKHVTAKIDKYNYESTVK